MSLKRECPCDTDGICPYESFHSGYLGSCEYWCGEDEPQDEPDYIQMTIGEHTDLVELKQYINETIKKIKGEIKND